MTESVISVEKAIATVLDFVPIQTSEDLAISDALGRVLAEDIVARREHPPWNNSAMDGYAVRWQDIKDCTADSPAVLQVIGEVQAGAVSDLTVTAGEAMQIMTGAPLPAGADAVVRVEDTRLQGETVTIFRPCDKGGNVRKRGEDIRLGERVIAKGTRVRPAEVGMLATAAYTTARVFTRPAVSILTTGNELVEPGEHLGPEKIINSNAYSLGAQVREAGALPVVLANARDDKNDLKSKMQQAIESDIAIAIGGVSVGKYDYVKEVIEELGCEIKFWRVKMRPGHPVAFGIIPTGIAGTGKTTLFFGLPGNPVSCMVAFYQFVLPAIRQMTGMKDLFLREVTAELEKPAHSRPGRKHFARSITRYEKGKFRTRLTGGQGSGMLTSMVRANSLLVFPESGGEFAAGDVMQVQLLPGFFS